MEKFPGLIFVYNNEFTQTNTAKSLLMAIRKFENEDVLWVNGDVYFESDIVGLLAKSDKSALAVDNKKCSDEEIKYTLNEQEYIYELSKQVKNAKGEALGINLVKKHDLKLFKEELGKVDNKDYFEKALENLSMKGEIELKPIDTSGYYCKEIDFPQDLEEVREHLS